MKTPPEFDHKRARPLVGHAAQHGLLSESSLYSSMRKHASLRHYLRAHGAELLLWRARSTFPLGPMPSTHAALKFDACTSGRTLPLVCAAPLECSCGWCGGYSCEMFTGGLFSAESSPCDSRFIGIERSGHAGLTACLTDAPSRSTVCTRTKSFQGGAWRKTGLFEGAVRCCAGTISVATSEANASIESWWRAWASGLIVAKV
jgi:hypothetical protein